MDTKHPATSSGGRDHHQAAKQAAAGANKYLPRTDNSDYLLPKSSMAYLDVIDDDTGQLCSELSTRSFSLCDFFTGKGRYILNAYSPSVSNVA